MSISSFFNNTRHALSFSRLNPWTCNESYFSNRDERSGAPKPDRLRHKKDEGDDPEGRGAPTRKGEPFRYGKGRQHQADKKTDEDLFSLGDPEKKRHSNNQATYKSSFFNKKMRKSQLRNIF